MGATKRGEANFSKEAILARLKKSGFRITAGRQKILAVLFSAGRPLTLTEIQDAAAQASGPKPDYATVFRMVTLLERMKLVQKVNLQRSCSYFELHDPARHYDHIICTQCGVVVLIDGTCPLHEFEESLEKKYGFQNLTHSLEFFGCCQQCADLP